MTNPESPPPGLPQGLPHEPFVPTSRRRRLVIAGLALGMTTTIGLAMLTPHAAAIRAALAAKFAEPPPCRPGQLRGCVGGAMDIFVLPAPAPAPVSVSATALPQPASAPASGIR